MGSMDGPSDGKGVFPPLVSLMQYLGRLCLQAKYVARDDWQIRAAFCVFFYISVL